MQSVRLATADVHLLTLAHQTGTHVLPTSETIVLLSQLSNATFRPFSSLCSAALGVLLQKCAT